MRVGVGSVRFEVSASRSLKDKRQVVRSVKDRVRQKFNVSVAEVGDLDSRNIAELGFACVSNDGRLVESTMTQLVTYIETSFPVIVLDVETELW
ncbi:MAG: DUF503 domain-containing protein [Candidatus Poribacteria bacterium]|nr:DUF503 domain-containing protein [Candidatus Poribacteria bacterium]